MSTTSRKIRYYYWLAKSFVSKNIRLISLSFIISFFLIFLSINFFPFINSYLFKKNTTIGMTGKYSLTNLPSEIIGNISNPLVAVTEKGEIMPVLVSSWEISDNSKIYRFHLKNNLFWSDGKKFTAHDIDFKFKGIEKKVLDDNTIEFQLQHPLSTFPIYLTKPLIRYPLKGLAGPYQVHQFNIKKNALTQLSLSPNKKDLPFINYIFYDSEDDLIAAYKKGEINVFKTSKKSIADSFQSWKNTKVRKEVNYNQILTVFFNTASGMTSDKDVRKAIVLSIPEFDEYGEKATGPIPPTSWAYSTDTKKYFTNLEKAETTLKKGKTASSSAELNLYTFYDYINVSEKIKKNLEKAGVKANLRVLSYLPPDFDILVTAWSPPTDPDQYYFWHSTQKAENITNYKNVKVDKLLEDGRSVDEIARRKEIYADFQKVIMEEVPAYFLYYPYVYTIEK